jgi:hypothetical protein
VVAQFPAAALFAPLTAPPLTSLTTSSDTRFGDELLLALLSIETDTPSIVAPDGIENPKFVAFR